MGWGKQGSGLAVPLDSTLRLPGFKSLCLLITSFSATPPASSSSSAEWEQQWCLPPWIVGGVS